MDFTPLTLDDSSTTPKERRFSVHDVSTEDNNVSYGKPDNQALDDSVNIIGISSDEHDDTMDKQISRSSIHSDSREDGSDNNENDVPFIHENVDSLNDEYTSYDNTDEYDISPANDNIDNMDDDDDQGGTGQRTRGSKENSPQPKKKAKDSPSSSSSPSKKSHYRHPSLADDEKSGSDDDDLSPDHGRFLSTVIHADVENDAIDGGSGNDDDDDGDDEEDMQQSIPTHPESMLSEYWCHQSKGLIIEEDTDAKLLNDKQESMDMGDGHELNIKLSGSNSVINKYTRPLICKINSNKEWNSVFGHGVISDTHSKYKNHENGQFIEWIIEVINIPIYGTHKASIIIGISSDLLGETKECNFTKNGFGFDNIGKIYDNSTKSREQNELLQFTKGSAIHLILDYSNDINWTLYAKIGDLEEEDYLNTHSSTNLITVFEKLNPASYRLGASLFNSDDALVIESCKIHGIKDGEFYQQLKSYSSSSKRKEEKEEKERLEREQKEQKEKEDKEEAERKEKEEAERIEKEEREREQKEKEEREKKEKEKEKKEKEEIENKKLKTQNQSEKEDYLSPPPMQITVSNDSSTSNNNALDDDDDDDDGGGLNALNRVSSVIIHSDVEITPDPPSNNQKNLENEKLISEQTDIIHNLKKQILELKQDNEAKDELISKSNTEFKEKENEISKLQKEVSEYKINFQNSENKLNEMIISNKNAKEIESSSNLNNELLEENKRLSHELQLMSDRIKSLDNTKIEFQEKLKSAVSSKMKLIISTSEEIDKYRKLIKQIAENKLGCGLAQNLKTNNKQNGHSNGYY